MEKWALLLALTEDKSPRFANATRANLCTPFFQRGRVFSFTEQENNKMKIVDFTSEWLEQAQELVLLNAREERQHAPALPSSPILPPLQSLTENGLGVAAVEGEQLLGFLGAFGPWKPVFTTPDTAGIFSPLHAHGVQQENREQIWQRLYQAAGEKWIKTGASSHAITLYAHDTAANTALYLYGFGVRCMDMIRDIRNAKPNSNAAFRELPAGEQHLLHPLRRQLSLHLSQSPCFMLDTEESIRRWLHMREEEPPRMFVAEQEGRIIAYMEAASEGENFLSNVPDTINICGAYCLPEYRGSGIAEGLLHFMAYTFRTEGYQRLGVDCESFNPTALHFWRKHFSVYTHSVVRRIDENVLKG